MVPGESAERGFQRRCGYREMPDSPCEAAVSWVITTGDGHSHQFVCDRHKDSVLGKVSPAHQVRPLSEWLASRQQNPGSVPPA
ncbi:MAG TPA: hypothetical protein VFM14_15405 [Gemmatimonadales bacterium]|nr:hypothetical protein [Gemmatimonadales bacterium]